MDHLSGAGKKRLKRYLKRVSKAMKEKGADKEEVEAVTESLKEQVIELVGQPEEKAGKKVIEEILGNFDPPSAFGEQVSIITGIGDDSTSWIAYFSVRASIAGVFISLIIGFIANASGGNGGDIGGVFFLITEIMALITGLVKIKTRSGRTGFIISAILLVIFAVAAAMQG